MHELAQGVWYHGPRSSAKLGPELEVTHLHSAPRAGSCRGSVLTGCLHLLSGKSQSCMPDNTEIMDILQAFRARVLMVVGHAVVKHKVFIKRMK